jgi:D-alanyl-lipoteichoic acid acyltransferase DltB (MBOAT superfamily)
LLFSSITFLFVFLPASLILYFAAWTTPLRNIVLLILSLIFYAWGEPVFLPVMIGAIGFNYIAARVIDARSGPSRRTALALALVVDLGLLGVFKYADFAVSSLAPFGLGLKRPGILLPLGISFFTFHCISYLVDVYRGRFPANRRLREVALYIALFPQLVAGPIVRYKVIARQLRARRHSLGRASAGMRMFVIGLAQKVLIADQLAPLTGAVFDHTPHANLTDAWTGALAYTLQIYFDFAGYSNMAIGLGLVFGFSLPRNFDMPYTSRSITEFWRRWHITLSSWFRDYLYIPLGGNRGAPWKTYRNLVVVFLLCGLWHGASWTFVLWGAWHGGFLVLERAGWSKRLERLPAPVAWAYAILATMFGWVLFRADDLAGAVNVWRGLLGLNGAGPMGPALAFALQPTALALMAIGAALALAPIGRRRGHRIRTTEVDDAHGLPALGLAHPPRVSRWRWRWLWTTSQGLGVVALLCLCVLQVSGGAYSPFLYFRF